MEWLPMKPDPPVTRIVLIQGAAFTAANLIATFADSRAADAEPGGEATLSYPPP